MSVVMVLTSGSPKSANCKRLANFQSRPRFQDLEIREVRVRRSAELLHPVSLAGSRLSPNFSRRPEFQGRLQEPENEESSGGQFHQMLSQPQGSRKRATTDPGARALPVRFEVLPHPSGVRMALVGGEGEGAENNLLQRGAEVRAERPGPYRGFRKARVHDRLRLLSDEREAAGQHLVENDPQAIEIAARV